VSVKLAFLVCTFPSFLKDVDLSFSQVKGHDIRNIKCYQVTMGDFTFWLRPSTNLIAQLWSQSRPKISVQSKPKSEVVAVVSYRSLVV